MHDALVAARPPAQASIAAAGLIKDATASLRQFEVAEARQIAGKRSDAYGGGQALVPPVAYDLSEPSRASGTVRFGRYYLGGNGAVHGGAIPLLFDQMMGRLSGLGGRPRARTAYLHVNYRAITPIDVDLHVAITVTRHEGRKLFIAGTLQEGRTLLADAEGLFVALKPGQP